MALLSLKAQNLIPLATLTLFTVSVALVLGNGGFTFDKLPDLFPTAGALAVASVVAVWFSYLIPAELKHRLVFLRWDNVLPGHRFLTLSKADSRIDFDSLRDAINNYVQLEADEAAQNRYWYKHIYRPLMNEPSISAVHKSFLLYRDAATVLIVCMLLFGAGWLAYPGAAALVGIASLCFMGLFTIMMLVAANMAGKRFVTTAVAVYLSKAGGLK